MCVGADHVCYQYKYVHTKLVCTAAVATSSINSNFTPAIEIDIAGS